MYGVRARLRQGFLGHIALTIFCCASRCQTRTQGWATEHLAVHVCAAQHSTHSTAQQGRAGRGSETLVYTGSETLVMLVVAVCQPVSAEPGTSWNGAVAGWGAVCSGRLAMSRLETQSAPAFPHATPRSYRRLSPMPSGTLLPCIYPSTPCRQCLCRA